MNDEIKNTKGFLNIMTPDYKTNQPVSYILDTGYKYYYDNSVKQETIENNLCHFTTIKKIKGLLNSTSSHPIRNLSELPEFQKVEEKKVICGFIILNSPQKLIRGKFNNNYGNYYDYVIAYLERYCAYQPKNKIDNYDYMLSILILILNETALAESRGLLDAAFNFGRTNAFIEQAGVHKFFKKLGYPIQYLTYYKNDLRTIKKALSKASLDPVNFEYNKNALEEQNSIILSSNPFHSSFIKNNPIIFKKPESDESKRHIIIINGNDPESNKIFEIIFANDDLVKEFIKLFKPIPEQINNFLKIYNSNIFTKYLETFAKNCNEPKSEHIILRLYISARMKKLYPISSQLRKFNFGNQENSTKTENVINDIRYMFMHIYSQKYKFIPYIIEDNFVAFLNFITKSWNFLIDINNKSNQSNLRIKSEFIEENIIFLQPKMKELYDEIFRKSLK